MDGGGKRSRRTGLVLTAGGSRGAYQAGVLRRIGQISALRRRPSPFPIVTGASAGAINGAAVASYASDFSAGTERLAQLWSQLTVTDVMRADARALADNARKLVLDLSLGSLTGAGRVASLFDSSPLRGFLARNLPVEGISAAVERGHLDAVAITATGYHSGKAFTFVQGQPGLALWNKSRRVALAATLGIDHVLASSSIPLVFPPVSLSFSGARAWFGDGALRLVTPLSPAIRLGAERLFAIGVRCQGSADDLLRSEMSEAREGRELLRPPLSQICGVFMNAIYLDHLDADVDHLVRMNDLVGAYSAPRDAIRCVNEPMRVIAPLVVSPSEDIAIIAKTMAHRMPRGIRYLLDGLGTPDAQSADLISYLLFDCAYTRELIDLGYRDAHRRIDEIETFLVEGTLAASRPGRRRRSTD
jgi:NTE family protein